MTEEVDLKHYRIMFVCHGNICRSPMAELIFRKMVEEAGLSAYFTVASSATSTEEIFCGVGNPVYPPARAELAKHGISADGKRAVQLTREDLLRYDLFVGMDSANLRNMHRILGSGAEGRIRRLMDYTARGGDVADPWYTGRFDVTFRDVEEGCRALLKTFLQNEAED
jgi:protein-tyrosine phosphatase